MQTSSAYILLANELCVLKLLTLLATYLELLLKSLLECELKSYLDKHKC